MAAARRFPPRSGLSEVPLIEPTLDKIPRLAPGCRMTQSAELGSVLLMPESMLRLSGPGPRIVELCDGERAVAEVIAMLQSEFSDTEPEVISREVLAFLCSLQERRALNLE